MTDFQMVLSNLLFTFSIVTSYAESFTVVFFFVGSGRCCWFSQLLICYFIELDSA